MTKKQQPRLQHGRRVTAPPTPTPEQRRRAATARKLQAADEQRREQAQQAAAQRTEDDARSARQHRDVVMRRAGEVGLTSAETTKLANTIEAKRQRATAAGKNFDVFQAVQDKLAALGYGVPVNRGNPLTAQLPPPAPEGHRPPPGAVSKDDESQRAEQARRAHDRAQLLIAQNRADREAYQDALRKHGLRDPVLGYPTGSGTSGFGL